MSKCIFRCDRSGVFYGEEVSRDGQTAVIKNARKLYRWHGANCAEQLAMEGTKSPDNCRFTMVVTEIEVYDLIQKIPCSDIAIKSIEEVAEWKIK